jgi:uncharacterized membrane protein
MIEGINALVVFVAALVSGLLAGNELATLIAFHPALRQLPVGAQIEAERVLTAILGRIMPVYMTVALAAAIAAAIAAAGRPAFGFALTAAVALGAMLAITLTQNLPLNKRTVEFPRDGDADAWSEIRRRWERLHMVRVTLDIAAFTCLVAALAMQ